MKLIIQGDGLFRDIIISISYIFSNSGIIRFEMPSTFVRKYDSVRRERFAFDAGNAEHAEIWYEYA
eukprot:CAMPEP_0178723518 /NCGR_PEP_ID=MMETSP0699-20121125/25588_1 /TAXON_ID=265572 /ORGANISM="Extubocellulus spinifer, Strain CCMP396" /LENGTH=65 /DNA_ID=CAMNT_0020374601 /DNA_START=55 /DNA_END=248 /DNA_ORIENTATION=+